MTALMNSCDGLVAQPSPRNREEMLTGSPHCLDKIIPLCLVSLAFNPTLPLPLSSSCFHRRFG